MMAISEVNTSVATTDSINGTGVYCSADITLFARPADSIIILLCALCVLCANSLNLVVLMTTPSMRNVHGYLLTALTGGGFGVGCMAAVFVYPVWAGCWPYGDAFCHISAYFAHTLLTYNLCVINLLNSERYVAISHPFRYRTWVTKKRTLIAIFVTLVVSFTIYVVPLATGHLETVFIYGGSVCLLTVRDMGDLPVSLAFIFVVMVPSVVIICMTSVVLLAKIARRSRRLPYLFGATTRTRQSGPSAGRSSSMLRRNTRLFVVSVLLVLAYFIWWIPFLVVVTVHSRMPEILGGTSWFVALSFVLGFFVSPMCNTVIYVFTLDVFKRRVKSLLMSVCCCCPPSSADVGKLHGRQKSKNSGQHEIGSSVARQ